MSFRFTGNRKKIRISCYLFETQLKKRKKSAEGQNSVDFYDGVDFNDDFNKDNYINIDYSYDDYNSDDCSNVNNINDNYSIDDYNVNSYDYDGNFNAENGVNHLLDNVENSNDYAFTAMTTSTMTTATMTTSHLRRRRRLCQTLSWNPVSHKM